MQRSSMAVFAAANGTHMHLDANSPFSLVGEEHIWFVEHGRLDIFYEIESDSTGELERARCFSVEADQVAFGLPLDTRGTLLATAIPETSVYRLKRSTLEAFEERSPAISLLDTYLNTLSSAIARGVECPPRTEFDLCLKERVDIPRNTIARPEDQVVWVRLESGGALYMGTEDMEKGDGWIPIALVAWLHTLTPVSVATASTKDMFWDVSFWDCFDCYQKMALGALSMNLAMTRADRLVSLREKAESDKHVVNESLLQLTSTIEGSGAKTHADSSLSPLAAACSLVAHHLGVPMKGKSLSGTTIEEVAESGSMRYRRVMLRSGWFKDDAGPMVAFLSEGATPVALLPSSAGAYALHDPTLNRGLPFKKEMEDLLEPFAYTLYKPLPPNQMSLWEFVLFGLRGTTREFIRACILGALLGLMGLVAPMLNEVLFNDIIPGAERGRLLQIVAILIGFSLSSLLINAAKSIAMLRGRTKASINMETSLWDRILRLRANFFRNYSAGDLAQRAMGITQTQHLLSGPALETLSSSLFAAFYLVLLLFYYDTRMASLAFIVISVSTLATALAYVFQIKYLRKVTALAGKISGITLPFITGIMKLRAGGAEDRAFALWAEEFTEQWKLNRKMHSIENGLESFNTAFEIIGSAVIFIGVIFYTNEATMNIGAFMAFWVAFGSLQVYMLTIMKSLLELAKIVPYFERLKPIFEECLEDTEIKKAPGTLVGNIEFSNVCFSYAPDSPLTTKNVSFTIKPKSFVAITGTSGAGKTTILRLLLGFEQPRSGSIFFEGKDSSQLDMTKVRKQMGVVLQGAGLMPGDIFTNIIGVSNLTLDDAWEAAAMAGLDKDIKAMPMGMNTAISEGASTLSGGQRQRLIIARALARKPSILVFDEATSALDNQTQEIVTQSLNRLPVTRIVIAHRLSTIKEADAIIVMHDGEIHETGTFDELVEKRGLFHKLVKRQMT